MSAPKQILAVTDDGMIAFNGGKSRVDPSGDVEYSPGTGPIVTDTDNSGRVYKIVVTNGQVTVQEQ